MYLIAVIAPSGAVSVTVSARMVLEKRTRIRERGMINIRVCIMSNTLRDSDKPGLKILVEDENT
jgi:hypothetical protein